MNKSSILTDTLCAISELKSTRGPRQGRPRVAATLPKTTELPSGSQMSQALKSWTFQGIEEKVWI